MIRRRTGQTHRRNLPALALLLLHKRSIFLTIFLLAVVGVLISSTAGLSYIPTVSSRETNAVLYNNVAPQHLSDLPLPLDKVQAMRILPSTNPMLETGPVSVVSADGLIQKPANYFDLEGKTLRFTPTGSGYTVQVLPLKMESDWGAKLEYASAIKPTMFHSPFSWHVPLPFAFPFAERSWSEVFVSLYGNISFGKSETALWSERDPLSDAGMRTIAAALDTRSTIGLEHLIAVFWADYQPRTSFEPVQGSVAYTRVTNQSLIVTWKVVREGYYAPLPAGVNIFQAQLFRSGAIELAYQQVPERDGIVGIFPGTSSKPLKLDYVKGVADIKSVAVYEVGSLLEFVLTMSDRLPVPSSPRLWYRIFFNYPGRNQGCEYIVTVQDKVEVQNFCEVDPPRSAIADIKDNTLTLRISKVDLRGASQFSWAIGLYRGEELIDKVADFNNQRVVNLQLTSQRNLSSSSGNVRGNVFEVFHYPSFPKWPQYSLEQVYKQFPTDDDIALVFTDFPFDVLRGGFNSAHFNLAIQGIGGNLDRPPSGSTFGSKRLQATMTTAHIGMGHFAEAMSYVGTKYHGYAFAASAILHEVGHRWLANLDFRNSQTNEIQSLGNAANGDCRCHWNTYLDAPPIFRISHAYTDTPYPWQEHSAMGGNTWKENANGTFTRNVAPINTPIFGGFSALDLYAIGLLAPKDVPDTFILQNVKAIANDTSHIRATKVPVRIQDVISAMGPRIPSSAESQKEFTFSIYLLHEPGRDPYPDMLARARGISGAGAKILTLATGGQLQVSFVPHGTTPVANYRHITTTVRKSTSSTLSASDRNGTLTYTIVTNSNKGVVKITNPATGAFTYTPNINASGQDSFTFKVSNGQTESNVAAVTITITDSSKLSSPSR